MGYAHFKTGLPGGAVSDLIGELKAEHTELIDLLLRVRALGGGSKDARARLTAAKEMLLSHLSKEDTQLYPALLKAADKDAALRESLAALEKELEEISAFAISFFDKYAEDLTFEEPRAEKKTSLGFLGDALKSFGLFRKENKEPARATGGFAEDFERLYSSLLTRIQKEENIIYTTYERLEK